MATIREPSNTDRAGTYARVEERKQTPTGNALNVQIGPGDVISNVPVVMEFEHHQVHEGETYKVIDARAALGTGTVKYGVTVPAYSPTIRGPHMIVECDIYGGAALVLVYELATFTGGSGKTSYNRNRNIANNAATTITAGVTSADGTLIDAFYCGAGSKAAGANRQSSEWVLKSGTLYRVDVVGQIAGTDAYVSFNWYEDQGL